VEVAPQLRDNKEVFPLDDTFTDCFFDAETSLSFILVNLSGVEHAVTKFDCVVNNVGCVFLGELPETNSQHGHLVTRGECKMSLSIGNGLDAVSDGGIANSRPFKWLTRVVSDGVVHYDEFAGGPAVRTPVLSHKGCNIHKHIIVHGGVITKDDSFLAIITRIDPAGVSSNNLVEEDFVTI